MVRAVVAVIGMTLYVGLNPALQRRVDVDELCLGSVNRARSSASGVGGKGQGAFLASLRLAEAAAAGGEDTSWPMLCMFLGSGREGDALDEMLVRKCGGGRERILAVRVASRCRICTTLVDGTTGDVTEIVEPSGAVTAAEWDALLEALDATSELRESTGRGLAALGILGSLPPGTPANGYSQVVQRVCGAGTRVLIDSVVDVRATLRAAALAVVSNSGSSGNGGVMLKLNAREILKLCGSALAGSDSQVAADPAAVAEACRQLADDVGERGVDYICYTDGPFPGGVFAVQSGRRWRLERTQPLRGPVISPIGAGDATSAGTLHAWCQRTGDDLDAQAVEAFRFGLGVGAASCLSGENGHFDIVDVEQILETIVATEL
mmetsp:Transcript_5806/g.13689  ORF Transcript_5806/g.13689 Transcript_5806/m.13689 type:complete len:378 (-) Transcript_5806:94-1227(-)|eukprot:CAMPEP_0171069536 /NCGR_PEP_ID=MMETSP0766_2-20121228/9203_1 /TAXON_ID=439317 /ORGANISM="Gambierdiscus australes, Strain CAWD 149" /LENGTH=377 /DNA_ID=CAMNT_0011525925 /DNA_START=60 /DNA_END=1193 /DNA_ORIENTATION=+